MNEDQSLIKVLGNRDVLALAFGAMIGWGWVVTAGAWIMKAGSLGAMLAFLVGGTMVILVGLTYAELASAIPLAGGELYYAYKGLGRVSAFITMWAIVLGYVSVVAFEAVALPTVFQSLFGEAFLKVPLYDIPSSSGGEPQTLYLTWLAVGVIGSILIAAVNYRGLKLASFVTFVLTVLIILAGILLIGGSSFAGTTANMEPFFVDGVKGFFVVLVMTPFMFVGFDVIPQAAEEIDLPRKRIGQLLVFSVALAIIWYIAVIFGVSRVLDAQQLADSDLVTADAMKEAFGGSVLMKNFLILAGVGGILTSWIGFYVGGSRAIYAMANVGMLPEALGVLHERYGTPHRAILLIAVLTTMAPFFGAESLGWLVNAGGIGLVVAWLMVSISFIVIRKKFPNMRRPFKLSGGTVIGWLAVLLSLFVFVLYLPGMPAALSWPHEWVIVLVWSVLGVVFYFYSTKSFAKAGETGTERANRIMDEDLERIENEEEYY